MNMDTKQDLYKLLFNAVAKGGFEEIAKAAYSYINHPIVLIDVEYKVVFQLPPSPIGDTIWDTLLKEHHVPSDMIWNFDKDNYVKTNREIHSAFLVDWGMVANLPRIMASVRVDEQIKGYIGILFPDGKCTKEDLASADIIVQALSMEFRRIMQFSSEILPLQNVFLSELFHGHIKSQNELKEWNSHVNLKLSKNYCLLAIQPERTTIDSVLLQYIQRQFESEFPLELSIVFDECIYLLITMVDTKPTMESFVQTQRHTIEPILLKMHLHAGISDRFDSLLNLSTYLYQAKHALILGKSNAKSPSISIYSNLVLEDILSNVRAHMEPRNYLHPALHILEEYDISNGSDYLNTLKTYITSMFNSTKTSKALIIHRNTLLYRLNRIVQLTGIDLDDTDTCTHLLLSFYLK